MFSQLYNAPTVHLFKEICGLKEDVVEKFIIFHEQKILLRLMKYKKISRAGHMNRTNEDKECIQNFVQETSCKTPTWKAEKEKKGQH